MTTPVLVVHDADGITLQHAAAGHPERPERTAAVVRHLRTTDLALEWLPATDAPLPAVERVHPAAQVQRLERLAHAGGGWIDADTYCTGDSVAAALRAAGGAMAAVDAACTGTHGAAFSLLRPPGHHAEAEAAMGFCLFNSAAIAVEHARASHGVRRVAIIDIDVHHGNGTEAVFWDDADVLYCSLHEYPFYPGTGAAGSRGGPSALGATVNVPLAAGTDAARWLQAFDAQVLPAVRTHAPELIVVSAGYDAHVADPLAGLRLQDSTYGSIAARVQELAALSAAGRSAWVLEGGYDTAAVSRSVECTLRELSA